MKKIATIIVAALLVLSMCFAFTACGNSTEGTYKFVEMTVGGVTLKVGDDIPESGGQKVTEDYMVIELKSDKTVVLSGVVMGNQTQTGTWAQEGDKVTITIDGEPQVFTLKGKTLSFSMTEGDMTVAYTLKK